MQKPTDDRNRIIIGAALAVTRDQGLEDWKCNSLHVGYHQLPGHDHVFLDIWLDGRKVAAFRVYGDEATEIVTLKVNTISTWLGELMNAAGPVLEKKYGIGVASGKPAAVTMH